MSSNLYLVKELQICKFEGPRGGAGICQPFLSVASVDFAALSPCLTVDSALCSYDNPVIDATTIFAARQLVLPVRQLLRLPILCRVGPIARQVELQDDRVMHDPVYCSRCRHRIGEHLLPLWEDQVGGDA